MMTTTTDFNEGETLDICLFMVFDKRVWAVVDDDG